MFHEHIVLCLYFILHNVSIFRMSKQLEAAELLRQAAAALEGRLQPGDGSSSAADQTVTRIQSTAAAARSLFAPYTNRAFSRGRGRQMPVSYYTHKFCVLGLTTQVIFSYNLCDSEAFRFCHVCLSIICKPVCRRGVNIFKTPLALYSPVRSN